MMLVRAGYKGHRVGRIRAVRHCLSAIAIVIVSRRSKGLERIVPAMLFLDAVAASLCRVDAVR